MTAVTLPEFVAMARARDIFGYNLKLVDGVFDDAEGMFQGAVVLDAGAGTRLKHFRRQIGAARQLIGVDIAQADLCRNEDVDGRAVGDIERLPFRSASFGCILSVDAVEHLEQPRAFFREAARCLEPGGRLIICTPNLLGYKNLITAAMPRPLIDLAWQLLRGRPGQPHPTYYRANTLRSLRRIGASVGLRVELAAYLNEVSHFLYQYPALGTLAYLYGRALERLGLPALLNYMVCVLRKKGGNDRCDPYEAISLRHQPHPGRA